MIAKAKNRLPIVDEFGKPLEAITSRRDLLSLAVENKRKPQEVRGTYDAARNDTTNQNHWANADYFTADGANSRFVRRTLVARSRYEIANNGYADGIAKTYATDLIGTGPKLRMQTSSPGFNAMVEAEWDRWSKAVQLRRKLWCMAHAKHCDGEAIGVLRTNPRVKHPVQLDVVLYETEHCQTPAMQWALEDGYIDGIKFDKFGNPEWYDILTGSPVGQSFDQGATSVSYTLDETPEQVPAEQVLHWFVMRRPGQHRGVPECSSTLNLGAQARRWREATLSCAEAAADIAIWLKTQQMPSEMELVAPMTTIEFARGMVTASPAGYDPVQIKGEHPNATFDTFDKALVREQARPTGLTYGKAVGDHSGYNFASGRLDSLIQSASIDVEREDGNDLVLDPLFDAWFSESVMAFGWLGGDPRVIASGGRAHTWDWPELPVADQKAQAIANEKNLASGSTTLPRVYACAGYDFSEEMQTLIDQTVAIFGVPVEVAQRRIFDNFFPPATKPPSASPDSSDFQDQLDEALSP